MIVFVLLPIEEPNVNSSGQDCVDFTPSQLLVKVGCKLQHYSVQNISKRVPYSFKLPGHSNV